MHVNVVPDTEIAPILSHHHVTERDPLYVGAVAEQSGPRTTLQVIEMEL